MTNSRRFGAVSALFFLISITVSSYAQTVDFFSLDGTNGGTPYAPLVQGIDGSLFGSAIDGGSNNAGTIFKISLTGVQSTVYNFCTEQTCKDGINPNGLVLGTDGNFYGTTGGSFGASCSSAECGTVFRVTPSGDFTTLYIFSGTLDGAYPYGPLVEGSDGNFYGTTSTGGDDGNGTGTVFEITRSGTLTTLYTFDHVNDGIFPLSGLTQGSDGSFYGTTVGGGTSDGCYYGCGTVFRITPSGKLTTIHNFNDSNEYAEGTGPASGVTEGSDGALYGTTEYGAYGPYCENQFGCGTIFKIAPTGRLTTLYTFCSLANCADGALPTNGLTQATDGNLYSVTLLGENIFGITSGDVFANLYQFGFGSKGGGYFPQSGLFQATDGLFYGTTQSGGANQCGCGTVYSVDMGLKSFVAFIRSYGKVGQRIGILGQGFRGTTGVSLNGTPASFRVVSDTFIEATVPAGATTGYVTVTTPGGTLTSNVPFRVLP
jgi:uncharacterized repeat protein (TIGR03803 family)